jgi:hypothetical protein
MKTKRTLKPTLSENSLESRLDLATMAGTVRTAVILPPGFVFHSPIGNQPFGGLRGPLNNAVRTTSPLVISPPTTFVPFNPIHNLPFGGLRGPLRNAVFFRG